MRKIKFRGKAVNGEWYYGLLSLSHAHNGQPPLGYYISNSNGMPWAYRVRPETVGQFTGLHDKNGVPIYEGDKILVEVCAGTWTEDEVVFTGGSFKRARTLTPIGWIATQCIEITGNIYEEDNEEPETYDCPIHGKQDGTDCPRC